MGFTFKHIMILNLWQMLMTDFCTLQEYNKALEDADEKVQLANQIYELVS